MDVVRGESSEFETLGIVDPVNSGSSERWIPPNLRFLDRKRFSGFPAHSIEKEARFIVSMQRHKIVKFPILLITKVHMKSYMLQSMIMFQSNTKCVDDS